MNTLSAHAASLSIRDTDATMHSMIDGATLSAIRHRLGAELGRPEHSYRPLRVGVVSTLLPGLKGSVVNKTLGVLEARLAPARATPAFQKA